MLSSEFLTFPEAAELLRIGERTVYDLARHGRIPAANVGGPWRIRRADLDAWIDQGGEASGSRGTAR